MQYKIFKNGVLYKLTASKQCVGDIVDRFLSNYVKNTDIRVEDANGKLIYQFWHF